MEAPLALACNVQPLRGCCGHRTGRRYATNGFPSIIEQATHAHCSRFVRLYDLIRLGQVDPALWNGLRRYVPSGVACGAPCSHIHFPSLLLYGDTRYHHRTSSPIQQYIGKRRPTLFYSLGRDGTHPPPEPHSCSLPSPTTDAASAPSVTHAPGPSAATPHTATGSFRVQSQRVRLCRAGEGGRPPAVWGVGDSAAGRG